MPNSHDYVNFPSGPVGGSKGTNSHFLTQGLFYEMRDPESVRSCDPRFCLSAEEKEWKGSMLPSAHQVYVHAPSEYDAILRITGAVEQWDNLCKLAWFNEWLRIWKRERQLRILAEAEKVLSKKMIAEEDVGAARLLLNVTAAMDAKGRPKKQPKSNVDSPSEESDHSRVSNLIKQ